MQEYVSCNWIQHGVSFENNSIEMCCLCSHEGGGRIVLKDNYNGKGIKWDEIFKIKNNFIEENKKGIINPKCKGCFNLRKQAWDDDKKYINYIHFNHWTNCNCDCIYCYTQWDKEAFNKRPHYKAMPMLKELINKNLFIPGGEITFAGGEPTILDEFDDIIDLLIKNGTDRITVHSSGIKYSKAIEKGIKAGVVYVCLSADSGTAETYNVVKRVDKFDKFWQNVEKYASFQPDDKKYLVETKYILIPDCNTNKLEIEKWFNLNLACEVHSIVFDIEDVYCKTLREQNIKMPEEIINLAKYMISRAKDLGFNVTYYNNFRYLAEEHNLL